MSQRTRPGHDRQGEYWRRHVLSWEAGAYGETGVEGRRVRLADRVSVLFRGGRIPERLENACSLLRPHVAGKTVLDVGCATGRFVRRLLEMGAARAIGVDVAEAAIALAERACKEAGLGGRAEFHVADATRLGNPLPAADIVTALGVIEYFHRTALDQFLGNLRSPAFLLGFPLRTTGVARLNPLRLLRLVYLAWSHCPGLYTYTLEEFQAIARPHGFTDARLVGGFVTNLPAA